MEYNFEEILNNYLENKKSFSVEVFINSNSSDLEKSEETYKLALEFYKENILELSEIFFEYSLNILEKNDKKLELSYLLHSLGSLKFKEDIKKASILFEKSLSIKKNLDDDMGMALLLKDMAYLEEISNNIDKSISLNKEALSYFIKNNLLYDIFNILIKLSDLDTKNSKKYLAQSLQLSLNNKLDIKDIIILISKYIKVFSLNDKNIPLIISSLFLVYKAKNSINEETNKIFIELLSSCALIRKIDNTSEWIKLEKFDNIEFSLKRIELFINNFND